MTAQDLVVKLNENILFPLIALLSAVAILVFLYGCFKFVTNTDDDSARTKGKQHILWGVIGLLVMVSAYAILNIAAGTFGLDDELDENSPTHLLDEKPKKNSQTN